MSSPNITSQSLPSNHTSTLLESPNSPDIMGRISSSVIDVPENQESTWAGQIVEIQEHPIRASSKQGSDFRAVTKSEQSLSIASDNVSSPSPKLELTTEPPPKIKPKRRRPTGGKANKAQQQILMHYYIRLFCKHFGSFGRMKTLSVEIQHHAEQHPYANLGSFHSDFYLKYMQLCEHTNPYKKGIVKDEIARFAWAEWHWWRPCVNLPMQGQRRELVRWVVEQLVVEEFDSKAFTVALDEVCQEAFVKIAEVRKMSEDYACVRRDS
ncbi:hypothetical protein H2200_006999 [Cladophialophora chaetospira]|uniref:Uncharacterized protein n=1 Tax=Cladophialophora chaetospira TaxID=386627 RepID=A0AA38X9W1_9EURO|nr:hypothetical protein H2200_006999 [Cladophialophora chaetospira]